MGEFLTLQNFTKQEKIGKSAFSKVFTIKEKITGNIYAAKISLNELKDDQKEFIPNLKREISIISQLNHPSILKFIGYSPINFEKDPYPVIVTEYASNGSLGNILQLERKSLSPPQWNDTKKLINIYGIASAMSYLHDHEIIHKDLKPSNILEDDYLFPKIADFGLSKISHKNDESMTTQSESSDKSTPFYIAPEIWESSEYTKAGDVYAFSFIIYEILTLEEPFKNYTASMIHSNVILKGDRPELKSPLTSCYKDLIQRCWSQNKNDRPTFKDILNELKNNQNFITDFIDKNEFLDYVDLIDSLGSSFDPSKKFKKIVAREENDDDEDDKSLTDFQKLSRIKGFEKLPKEIQDFFEKELNNPKSDKKTINISMDITKIMYESGLFKSHDFINVLSFFNKILFDVEHDINQLTEFKSIYKTLSDLIKTKLQTIRINIITSHISNIKEFLQQNGTTFSVTLSSSVTSISENAFCECSLMTQITIPRTVSMIKSNAFSECSLLEQINIPLNVSVIGESCFFQCSSITSFSIPSKVTLINDFTFQQCSKLTKISIPTSVTLIGDYAFDKCSQLNEISIPSSVLKIGDFAFNECSSLKHVSFDLNSSLNFIGDFAFRGCVGLTLFEFPQHVNSIGEYAFKDCTALFNISLTYSVCEVGNCAFDGCIELAQITIPLTAPLKKVGQVENTPIITQIINPSSAKRKSIGIRSDVNIVKSTKCSIA